MALAAALLLLPPHAALATSGSANGGKPPPPAIPPVSAPVQATPAATGTVQPAARTALTEAELEILVARIALYPDDLVALIISSAVFPLQVVQAERFLEQRKTNAGLKPSDKWDGSVISLLNYPNIVRMMSDDLAWTEELGGAAVNQQQELLAAIQGLREQAEENGVLKSNDKVVVEEVSDKVVIRSADPEVAYVPVYAPEVLYQDVILVVPIYYEAYPWYYHPWAPWWAGWTIGAAWGSWIDWDHGDCWSGKVDVHIDHDGHFHFRDFGKGDGGWNRDWRNVDRRDFDRAKFNVQNVSLDRGELAQSLRGNTGNNLASKAAVRQEALNRLGGPAMKGVSGGASRAGSGSDIRNSVTSTLRNPSSLPRPGRGDAGSLSTGKSSTTGSGSPGFGNDAPGQGSTAIGRQPMDQTGTGAGTTVAPNAGGSNAGLAGPNGGKGAASIRGQIGREANLNGLPKAGAASRPRNGTGAGPTIPNAGSFNRNGGGSGVPSVGSYNRSGGNGMPNLGAYGRSGGGNGVPNLGAYNRSGGGNGVPNLGTYSRSGSGNGVPNLGAYGRSGGGSGGFPGLGSSGRGASMGLPSGGGFSAQRSFGGGPPATSGPSGGFGRGNGPSAGGGGFGKVGGNGGGFSRGGR